MQCKTVLVIGGAGYIGSHTSWLLHNQGYRVIILDSFLYRQSFNQPWATLIKSDFADSSTLIKIFTKYKIDCVMHFAALIEVGESVKNPRIFYKNNISKTLELLDLMVEHGVNIFIFSSSCAVYGVPQTLPLEEIHPLNPTNPYGKSKLAVEFALQDYSKAYDLRYVALRYFNAAGACYDIGLGEQHIPESHIVPILLHAAKNGDEFNVFGDDYQTEDGTCIRDYVHVLDIAQAHILALNYLELGGKSDHFNLGSGVGTSIKQLIENVSDICGCQIRMKTCPRRNGDVSTLIASSSKANAILGWKPQCSDIKNILQSALKWEAHRSI